MRRSRRPGYSVPARQKCGPDRNVTAWQRALVQRGRGAGRRGVRCAGYARDSRAGLRQRGPPPALRAPPPGRESPTEDPRHETRVATRITARSKTRMMAGSSAVRMVLWNTPARARARDSRAGSGEAIVRALARTRECDCGCAAGASRAGAAGGDEGGGGGGDAHRAAGEGEWVKRRKWEELGMD